MGTAAKCHKTEAEAFTAGRLCLLLGMDNHRFSRMASEVPGDLAKESSQTDPSVVN